MQEYLVWRVNDAAFDWFRLSQGRYIKVSPNLDGIIYSSLFPGLWLDVEALLAGNVAKVLDVLKQGLSTAEHQAFIAL